MINTKNLKKWIEKTFPTETQKDIITISKGNSKMGEVPSFSVLPVVTCCNCQKCYKDCYAVKMCRLYKNVDFSYAKNTYLLLTDPKSVFNQLNEHFKYIRFFRFNVSGDIFNLDYLKIVVKLAKENAHVKILLFTKNYELFNQYFSIHKKPNNLQVIFSKWNNTINNPLSFPTSDIFSDSDFIKMTENDFLCGGSCKDCFINCCGCFALRQGQNVYFKKH